MNTLVLATVGTICGVSIATVKPPIHLTTICHHTKNEKNPYVRIVVDKHSIGGHRHHKQDVILDGEQACPSPSDQLPTPEPSPAPSPAPETPTPVPTTPVTASTVEAVETWGK